MTAPQSPLDSYGTLMADAAAMRVREALLALLRSWEDMHGLPRSVPKRLERAPRASGGHEDLETSEARRLRLAREREQG